MAKEYFKCSNPEYDEALKQRDAQILDARMKLRDTIFVDNDPGNYIASLERVLYNPFRMRKGVPFHEYRPVYNVEPWAPSEVLELMPVH